MSVFGIDLLRDSCVHQAAVLMVHGAVQFWVIEYYMYLQCITELSALNVL